MMQPGYPPAQVPLAQQQGPVVQLPTFEDPNIDIKLQLSNMVPDDRKQFVGNAIYGEIETYFNHFSKDETLAGRITGMLIDENVVDFNQLLTNQGYLNMKVREAY